MKYFAVLFSIMAGLTTFSTQAQDVNDDSVLLDQIIVTANRTSSELATIPQSVIVIDDQQIEEVRYGSNDLTDILTTLVPGFQPSNQTVSGASETFRGRSVLIMVDGVPRNTPLRDNTRILSLIDIETIERIEVINGASSLYGAGATGGLINIITKRGTSEKPRVALRTELSAYTADPRQSIAPSVNVNVEGIRDRFDYFLSTSAQFSRETFDGKGRELPSDGLLGQAGFDRAKQFNFFGGAGFEDDSRRFDFTGEWTYYRQNPDYLTDYSTDPVSPDYMSPYFGDLPEENSQYLTGVFSESDFFLGHLEIKSYFNHIEKTSPFTQFDAVANNTVYIVDGSTDFNQTILTANRAGLMTTVRTPLDQWLDGAGMTWGGEYTFDDTTQVFVDHAEAIAPMTQNQIAAFVQLDYAVNDHLHLHGGARFDQFFLHVDDFNRPTYFSTVLDPPTMIIPAVEVIGGDFSYSSPTFNAGAVWDVTMQLQIFGNFSQGYSLTDIGAFTRRAGLNSAAEIAALLSGQTVFDYSDIGPEPQIVNTYESGLRGEWGRLYGTISGYISTSDNGVTYDFTTNQVSQQKEEIWGVEVNAVYDALDDLTFGGVFAYINGRYDGSGMGDLNAPLPNNRIPNTYKANIYSELMLPRRFLARAEVEYFSGRDVSGQQKLEGATLLNLGLTRDFREVDALTLSIRNVLDSYYINPTATAVRGYEVAGQGRTVALSYSARF